MASFHTNLTDEPSPQAEAADSALSAGIGDSGDLIRSRQGTQRRNVGPRGPASTRLQADDSHSQTPCCHDKLPFLCRDYPQSTLLQADHRSSSAAHRRLDGNKCALTSAKAFPEYADAFGPGDPPWLHGGQPVNPLQRHPSASAPRRRSPAPVTRIPPASAARGSGFSRPRSSPCWPRC